MTPVIPPHTFFPRDLTELVFLSIPRSNTDETWRYTSWVSPGYEVLVNLRHLRKGGLKTVCELQVQGAELRALYGENALEWRSVAELPGSVLTKTQQHGWWSMKLSPDPNGKNLVPDWSELTLSPRCVHLMTDEGEHLEFRHRTWVKGESANIIEISHGEHRLRLFNLHLASLLHALQPGLEGWFATSFSGQFSAHTLTGQISASPGELHLPWASLPLSINARRVQQFRQLLFSPPQP